MVLIHKHQTGQRVRECFSRFKIGNMIRGFELQKAGYFKGFQQQLIQFKETFEDLQKTNDSLSAENNEIKVLLSEQNQKVGLEEDL